MALGSANGADIYGNLKTLNVRGLVLPVKALTGGEIRCGKGQKPMRCPKCGSKTYVIDSRYVKSLNTLRRRRSCLVKIGHRFSTGEFIMDFDAAFKNKARLKSKVRQVIKILEGITLDARLWQEKEGGT